jgi:preprotein translocase subunit SecA
MGVLDIVGVGVRKIFGSRNERLLKRFQKAVVLINALEDELRGDYDERFAEAVAKLPLEGSDENVPPGQGGGLMGEGQAPWDRAAAIQQIRVGLCQDLRDRSAKMRERLAGGEPVEEVLPEAFAVMREASRRAQNHRHFDCQLIGGQVLFEGKIAEMKTGEGKTIVCHLAAYLKGLQGKKVHIVTVNDYLVQRDAEFARPIFELVGMTVGYIQSQVDPGGREGIRQAAYACNITYGTNSEFGFDYLRDNMKTSVHDQVQGRLDFAVVDEVDSILIDEARTPLIISGPAEDDVTRYRTADAVSRVLIGKQTAANTETSQRLRAWGDHPPEAYAALPKFQDAVRKFKSDPNWVTEEEADAIGHKQFYVVTRERKQVALTHAGVTVAQEQLGVGSLYVGANMEWPHVIENSLRAHVVYEKDVDYAVMEGEIIIVDQFTGRLMHGRQWSDGLHQAVEAKEAVKVKEETQTLATITLQNFFKLYEHAAGMTGTAMTEADEFMKIYTLEVVAIPTNRPVNRMDFHDRIYKNVEDKYNAIVEEIHDMHTKGRPNDPFVLEPVLENLRPILAKEGRSTELIDKALKEFDGGRGTGEQMAAAYDDAMGELAQGRPVLVGTISIENSEKLSNLLTRKYGIQHEVLNAKQHAREAEIVTKAGEQHTPTRGTDKSPRGNVTIATNMAGRGTDIKLQKGVVYPKCVGDLGPPANSNGRHYVWREKGVVGTKCCIYCPDYDPSTNCAHCWKPKADPRFPAMGRKVCPLNAPCGLHIVGTERHESRRIDNQLRGRSGRQGDPGSSRFFLSLGDDLLKMFMGEWTLKMLERMGFQDGMAIEAKSINKGIERAQKKVEEKNFGIRKHLLEYDEVMDHQRKVFYARRQEILEAALPGKCERLVRTIWAMIDATIETAAAKFLDPYYGRQCVCDWAAAEFGCGIDAKNIMPSDVVATERLIRNDAKEEAYNEITKTVGEYMDADTDPKEWDIRGLARWAETRFGSTVSQNQLRSMSIEEVQQLLLKAGEEKIEATDLTPIEKFLDPLYSRMSFINWARQKFGIELRPDDFVDLPDSEITKKLHEGVEAGYREREVRYPVEVALERTLLREGPESAYAADALSQWVNLKFNLGWTVDNIRNHTIKELADELVQINRDYITGGKLEAEIDAAIQSHQPSAVSHQPEELSTQHSALSPSPLAEWAKTRFGPAFDAKTFEEAESARDALLMLGHDLLRRELTALERYVLLEIYDQAWKDHMHAIDLLKEAIGLRGYAEQDPKIAYKREGFQMFREMMDGIQDKVTGIIFKARLLDESILSSRYRISAAQHADATNTGFTPGGQVQKDRDAAMQAQGEQVVQTIRREQPKVGRNEPCPCGSGKKFKQCHGKTK